MKSNQLRVFYAVAKNGSFSGAAESLSLTQPAVSDHIRKIEEAYGTRLFTRGPKGAVLTDVGRKLLAIAERHVEAENEAELLLSRVSSLTEGSLTIGADAAIHILPAVKHFRDTFPGVAVRIESGNSHELAARLREFEIDAAVVARLPAGQDIAARLLRRDVLVLALPKASLKKLGKSAGLQGLAQLPLVLREDGSATRELALAMLERSGIKLAQVLEVSGRETCLEAVAQGMGATIISRGELSGDAKISIVDLSEQKACMEEHLIYLRTRMNLRVIRAFLASVDAVSTG